MADVNFLRLVYEKVINIIEKQGNYNTELAFELSFKERDPIDNLRDLIIKNHNITEKKK